MDPKTRFKLSHTVTEYDRQQSTKRGYNIYALAMYCGGVQEIEKEVDAGTDMRAAILGHFCGSLANRLLKAMGLPKMTDAEKRGGLPW